MENINEEELDLVTFSDEEGNEFQMEVWDYFEHEGQEYAILFDLESEQDEDAETEVYIMKVTVEGEDEIFLPADEDKMDELTEIVARIASKRKTTKSALQGAFFRGWKRARPTVPLPGLNHTLFICPDGGGRIDFRYGEAPAENRPAGGSDRLSGGVLPHRSGGGRPRPGRGPVHRPLPRHGRRHPSPARPALPHPRGGPGPPAAKKGGMSATPAPKLPLAQHAGVGGVKAVPQAIQTKL